MNSSFLKSISAVRISIFALTMSVQTILSNNLKKAIAEAKDILKDKKNIQVKFTVKSNDIEFESATIYIRKIKSKRIEQLKNELVQRFPNGNVDEIKMLISKIPARKVKCPNCKKEMREDHLTRHLHSCIKENYCPICRKAIDGIMTKHIEECSRRYYACNFCGEKFNTGARRTVHEKKCRLANVSTKETAFGALFKIIEIKPPQEMDFEGVLEDEASHIANILEIEIKTTLRFYILLEVVLDLNGETNITQFQSRTTALNRSMDFETEVQKHIEILLNKIDEYSHRGSDCIVDHIKSINITITYVN